MHTQKNKPIQVTAAVRADLPAILALQYLAYQSEAKLLSNPNIPPLKQTLEELELEFVNGTILKALDEHDTIIGSVRGRVQDGTLFVGKLIVHPEHQGQGLGTRLLAEIEQACPHQRCELFTSSMSERNIKLYQRVGYQVFKEEQVPGGLTFIYLEKSV